MKAGIFDAPAYRLLRSMVGDHPNDLFIAGDNHQQIYGKHGCEAVELGRADVSEKPGIRVSTMHRAKGLEFDYVVVADIDKCPPAKQIQAVGEDKTALAELYKEERNLLYVAMTRPRKGLLGTAVR